MTHCKYGKESHEFIVCQPEFGSRGNYSHLKFKRYKDMNHNRQPFQKSRRALTLHLDKCLKDRGCKDTCPTTTDSNYQNTSINKGFN